MVFDAQILAKFLKLGVVKLLPIVLNEYVWNAEPADYVLPYKAGDLGFYDRCCWLVFDPLSEVVDYDDEELVLLPSHGEWSRYVDPSLSERPWCNYRRHWLT